MQATRCQPAVVAGEPREPAASQEDPSKGAGEATEEAAPAASAPEPSADEFLHAKLDPASLDFPPLLELTEAVPVPVPKEDVAAQADRAQLRQAASVASTATDARHACFGAASQLSDGLLAGPALPGGCLRRYAVPDAKNGRRRGDMLGKTGVYKNSRARQ